MRLSHSFWIRIINRFFIFTFLTYFPVHRDPEFKSLFSLFSIYIKLYMNLLMFSLYSCLSWMNIEQKSLAIFLYFYLNLPKNKRNETKRQGTVKNIVMCTQKNGIIVVIKCLTELVLALNVVFYYLIVSISCTAMHEMLACRNWIHQKSVEFN